MAEDWKGGVRRLFEKYAVGFLATQGEFSPETSMTPFAIDRGDILLHLSTLARHTKNIQQRAEVGFMVCTPESEADSPLALSRISFQGCVALVPDAELESAKAVYLSRIPDAEPLFDFSDFSLFRLRVTDVFWVGGFGSARKIGLKTWQKECSVSYPGRQA
jgi:putative heme iron utilization protein